MHASWHHYHTTTDRSLATFPRDHDSALPKRPKLDRAVTMDQGWPLKQSLLQEGGCRAILRWSPVWDSCGDSSDARGHQPMDVRKLY
jgi:hypothetical protein